MIIGHFHQDIETFDTPGFGYVEEVISLKSPGRVHYMGTNWPAQLYCPARCGALEPDTRVLVVGHLGIVMLVAPTSDFKDCPRKNRQCSRDCVLRLNETSLSPSEI